MATKMDGKALAAKIRADLKTRVAEHKSKHGRGPGLAVFLVGDDPASEIYVNNKNKACVEAGIKSVVIRMHESTPTEELLAAVEKYNNDDTIHGILVQLPLPKHIDEKKVIYAIDPAKDVDGFHPFNVGLMYTGDKGLAPCTPAGCMKILEEYNISTRGKNAVVVGASNIVGRPMSAMLLAADCTVTTCHIYTQNLKDFTSNADILVTAIGCPEFFKADHVKEGAVIIDIGINRVDGKVVGDVAYAEVSEKASHITPVPGGVGPMTIAMLLDNTVKAFEATLD